MRSQGRESCLPVHLSVNKEFALANSRAERVLPQADKYLMRECASLSELLFSYRTHSYTRIKKPPPVPIDRRRFPPANLANIITKAAVITNSILLKTIVNLRKHINTPVQ
jgi:hypothetical protein